MKSLLPVRLSVLTLLIFLVSKLYSQSVAISTATGGLATAPMAGGAGNLAVLGVQLSKGGGGANTVTDLSFSTTSDPNGKFVNPRLYSSTDATFSGVGVETLITTGTLNATNISFTGTPITNFGGGNGAVTEYYFVVIDVVPGVTATTPGIQSSLASTGVTVSTSTVSGSTITGTNYTFVAPTATIALLTNGIASSPLQAGATGEGVFGFSITSNGAQTVTEIDIQVTSNPATKWGSYSLITSTDADYSTTGDNSAAIGGLTFTPSTSQIAITGLSQGIPSSAVNFFLVANINTSTNASTTAIKPSLVSGNVTVTTGTVTGTATGTNFSFAPLLTISNLSTGLAASPLTAGATGQGVFGFNLSSSGSQTVTAVHVQVTNGSPASKWTTASYKLITSTDASFSTTGDNSAPIGSLTFTPSATEIAITGLSQVITSGTNYFLVVDIDPSVTGATSTIQPSLGSSNIAVSSGANTGSATGTNYSFGSPTATFTEITSGTAPVISGTVLSAGSTLQVLTGFSVTSTSTQQINSIGFNYTGLSGQWAPNEYLYKSSTAGTIGSIVQTDTSPDGNFAGLSETINSTPVYYYLVVDVSTSVIPSTASVTTAPTEANIALASGNKNTFSISRTFTFNTSQTSDIAFTVSSGTSLNYRSSNLQASTINDTDLSKSFRLGTFQIRDGGSSLTDGDDKATSITSITISVTHPANINAISLFNDDVGPAEIPGTEQTMPGSGIVIFNPTTPIRTTMDGAVLNFIVRVTFNPVVTDNDDMIITITSVTGESGYSGFAASNAGGATSTSGTNHTIIVTASKFILQPTVAPNPSPISSNFGMTIKAVDGNPLNNKDLDYNGKVDLTASGGSGTLSGGGSLTLSSGQIVLSTLKINQSGSYTLEVSDDNYTDPPDSQADLGDVSANITITSSSSSITQGTTTPATICYGSSYFPLSNIVITETDPAGISGSAGSYTFSIALPSGFVFDQSVTSGVSTSGGSDITIPSAPHYSYPSANIVQFSYNLVGTSNTNTITISGLKVGRPHPGTVGPAPTGALSITRSGGSGNIAGVASGTTLGTVNASEQAGAVTFTVAALAGDVAIDPNTTNFNVSANAVKLVGSSTPGVFTGSGITFVSPDYRFNPNTLAPGNYTLTYTYTNGSGCQSVGTKAMTVFTSGINGLLPSYCNNDLASSAFTVNQTFIDQRMGGIAGTWQVDHYVYYDPFYVYDIINQPDPWTTIATPANDQFDPSLPVYQNIVQYFGGQIPIGFAVCNGLTVPCNGKSRTATFSTYQWVTVKPAPSVSLSIPKTTFCVDEPAVVLTGFPANSNTIADDFFDDSNPSAFVTVTPADPRVWSFNPAASGGAGSVDITYTYKEPSTGCIATSSKTTVTINPRPTSVTGTTITSPGGTSPATCQGIPIGTFTATTVSGTTYTWYSDALLTSIVGTGDSFTPPNPPVDPNVATDGTPPPHKFYVTQTIKGCESNKQPTSPPPALDLTVTINQTPSQPVPNFDREYCVGDIINPIDLQITSGTSINWYKGGSVPVLTNVPSPTPSQILTNLGISNAVAAVHSFQVTQTASGCEGLINPSLINVTIKGLPSVSISADLDPTKICTTGNDVTFTAVDLAVGGTSAPNGTWSGIGSLNPFPSLGQVVLNPSGLSPGSYTLQYTYKNSLNCTNSNSIAVTVLPKITPVISVGNVCDESPAVIINNSTISSGTSTIAFAEWEFGDGSLLPQGSYLSAIDPAIHSGKTTGTYKSPNHIYPNVGTFQIKGVLTSSDGCRYTFPAPLSTIPVNVSPLPKANFTWKNVCVNSLSSFFATTNLPNAAIQSYDWDFAKGDILAASSEVGTGKNVTYTYVTTGKDSVRLIVTTIANCKDTITKPVYIVPVYPSIDATNSYSQDFASNDGWIAGGKNLSWALGTPAGSTIIGDATAPFTGNAWDTNLTGSNNQNESSWVLSGCFDFTGSLKPVVSLDVWSDNPSGVDGAVLQYNLTGNIEDDVPNAADTDGDWEVVGSVNSGINWYDDQGISNSPGNQTTVSAGWTGRYSKWKRAVFKLDPLIGESNVAFRVAFASAQPRGDGFAFDNIFIGERSRIVLLENFTNSSAGSSATTQNAFYKQFGNASEVVKIQYHTPFPGSDPINQLNHEMNNARTAFYGITESPTIRLDGDFQVGNVITWLPQSYDDRVLTPALIKLTVTAVKDDKVVKVNTSIENLTNQTIPLSGVHVFTTIVQKSIIDPALLSTSGNAEFVFVAKQMLPSPSGIMIPSDLPAGQTYNAPEVIWSDPDGDAITVFIQSIEGDNKNVYQAQLIDTPPIPDLVTGTEPDLASQISIYPSPANKSVIIQLPKAVIESTPVKMFDVNGHEVHNSVLKPGEIKKTINTQDFAAGVYLIQIETAGAIVRKKLVVMHEYD